MRRRVLQAETLARLDQALTAQDAQEFLRAIEFAAAHGFGKPAQPVVGADGGPLAIQVRFVHEG